MLFHLQNKVWQPLGPLLKVKLLVGYMRHCLRRVDALYSRLPGLVGYM